MENWVGYVAGKRLVIEMTSVPKYLMGSAAVGLSTRLFYLPVSPVRHKRPTTRLSPYPAPKYVLMIQYIT